MHLQTRGTTQLGQHECKVHRLPAQLYAGQTQRCRQAGHVDGARRPSATAAAHDSGSKAQVVLLDWRQQQVFVIACPERL